MKLLTLFLLICLMQATAAVKSQTLTLHFTNASLEKVLVEVKKQSGYSYIANSKILKEAKKVTINIANTDLREALRIIFKDQGLLVQISDGVIHIEQPKNETQENKTEANQDIIRGRVTDSNGIPMGGVTVQIKGTYRQTMTNSNGEYEFLNVDKNAILTFSFVGYLSREVKAFNEDLIVLNKSELMIEEVQVSKGYYTTTKDLNTGSVSSVKAEVFERQPVGDPILALSGRVPGLHIQQNSGVPGTAPTFSLRGQNSIANGNNPLFVIDGVPYLSDYEGLYASGAAGAISPFGNIPIQAIESIDVLKDADATAIYGSRGANGVILITTKKSLEESTSINFDFNRGAGNVTNKLDLMNTEQYLDMRKQAFENDGATFGTTDYDVNGIWDQTRYTDWQDIMIGGTAQLTNSSLGIRGGSPRTQFGIIGSYRHETTVFPGNSYNKQYGGLVHLSHESQNKRFRISLNTFLANQNASLPQTDFTTFIVLAPNAPQLYNQDGTLNWEKSTWSNPFRSLYLTSSTTTKNLNNDVNISYQIANGFSISSRFGYNDSDLLATNLSPLEGSNPDLALNPLGRRHAHSENNISSWNIEPIVTYDKEFKNSSLNFLIGTAFQESRRDESTITGVGFASDAQIENLSAATTLTISNINNSQYRYNAVYSRIGYNYLGKYIFNFTGRRDGSSRFGPGKQFGNFWSIAGAWIFSKELFFPTSSFLSFGKLRTSYGVTGNDQLGDYKYISTYLASGKNYQGIVGITPTQHTNTDYGWESVNKLDLALELGLLNDRIQITANWYRNRTDNQLVGYQLPLITGFENVQANLPAIIQNTGTEVELNANILNKPKLTWSIAFNLTIPRNKLVAYPDLETSSYRTRYVVGKPLSGSFLYNYTGLDSKTQLPTFSDLNNDGFIRSTEDRELAFIGQRSFAGLNNSFTFHNRIQLDIFLQFVNKTGYEFYGAFAPGRFLNSGNNIPLHILDENSMYTQFSRLTTTTTGVAYNLLNQSDAIVGDASFIRLKNIAISWSMPEQLKKMLRLKQLKLYAQGQNLITFTKYKGLDPEATRLSGTSGVPKLPALRMITMGLQLTL